jgi:hypothetical protein
LPCRRGRRAAESVCARGARAAVVTRWSVTRDTTTHSASRARAPLGCRPPASHPPKFKASASVSRLKVRDFNSLFTEGRWRKPSVIAVNYGRFALITEGRRVVPAIVSQLNGRRPLCSCRECAHMLITECLHCKHSVNKTCLRNAYSAGIP